MSREEHSPPPANHHGGDEVEATGHEAEVERLAGRTWMALESADAGLRAAEHYIDPAEGEARRRRLVEERAETIDDLHGLAHDLHTDSPLLHWLDVPTATRRLLGLPNAVRACVFDLDAVLTTSASIHVAAWADTFDSFLLERAVRRHQPFLPFDRGRDYTTYVAGLPRLAGVRRFLSSRGITVPEGHPDDPISAETVHGLANRKTQGLRLHLEREGVAAYIGSRCYLEAAHMVGIGRAVVSASAATGEILKRAGLDDLLDARIDAATMEADGLLPKPAPDTLLAACQRLGVAPSEAAAFETESLGIEAARAAGMALVVAVRRDGTAAATRPSTPDVIVSDLAQLLDHRRTE
jgi:HAD superfamily hydrolase (TIGR01509 family)